MKNRNKPVSASWLLMAAGYLVGCVIGACVAIKADSAWMTMIYADSVDTSATDLLSVFCGYCSFVFGMILLSTSYLGFLLIPGVFSVKGFLSGCVFTAAVREMSASAIYRAVAELLIPGAFLLPALLVVGQLCLRWSVRLLRCRSGETLSPGPAATAPLGLSFTLLLLASATKTYVVPFILNLF